MRNKILRVCNQMLKKIDEKFFGGSLLRKRDNWALSIAKKYPPTEYAFLREGKPYIHDNGKIRFSLITEIAPADLIWLQYNSPICDTLHGRYDLIKAYREYMDAPQSSCARKEEIVNINQNGVLLDGVNTVIKAFVTRQDKLSVRINYIANIPIQYRLINGEKILFYNTYTQDEKVSPKRLLTNLLNSCRSTFFLFIWPPAMTYHKDIISELQEFEELIIQDQKVLNLSKNELMLIIEKAYNGADKTQEIIRAKKQMIINASKCYDEKYSICVIEARVKNPCYHFHSRTGCLISFTLDEIKKNIRTKWAPFIENYSYDNIIHSTDNHLQNVNMAQEIINFIK